MTDPFDFYLEELRSGRLDEPGAPPPPPAQLGVTSDGRKIVAAHRAPGHRPLRTPMLVRPASVATASWFLFLSGPLVLAYLAIWWFFSALFSGLSGEAADPAIGASGGLLIVVVPLTLIVGSAIRTGGQRLAGIAAAALGVAAGLALVVLAVADAAAASMWGGGLSLIVAAGCLVCTASGRDWLDLR